MKQVFSTTGMLALAILFTSAISMQLTPQDPPQKPKKEKHIKMVKVTDGKKMELDTVIEADKVLIWNGDTITDGKKMKWVSNGTADMDFDMDFDMDVDEDDKGNVFILKKGGDDEDNVITWQDKDDNEMIFGAPHGAHKMMFFGDHKKGNVIDLSDPGIISFDKKILRNGNEKITIIREKPSDEDEEIQEEVIMHGSGSQPMIIHEKHPGKKKQIKVIANDNGTVEILEDGKVWSVDEGDEDVKVIEKDGNKIIIKKIKKGDEVEVEVEVEEQIDNKDEKKQ